MDDLWHIRTDFACFGIVAKDGKVIGAAPIAAWTIGKDLDWALRYWQGRGARTTLVMPKGDAHDKQDKAASGEAEGCL